ncbi:tRNA guanosine(34) transglycosylase Tgt [Candidatus Pacearchaeota archaeon]|nr:tRNA guanosine(34) transglycosylase Tgt [Candidatus Pacearchaeota archaeon]
MSFTITHKDKHTKARIGILKTKSGDIETPFFMPVATKATAKYINSKKLQEITPAIISNAFLLSLRPGVEIIRRFKGIKKFMNYKGITFTDSGGFQMYSDYLYITSNEKGVYFRNPISGEKIFMTSGENMKLQQDINADVAMCLDSMPIYKNSKEEIKKAVELTINWAEKCKKEHDRLQENIMKNKKQLLFCISQGGIYKDLREYCIKELAKLNFDGYAIGGIALPEALYGKEMEKAKKLEQQSIKIHKKFSPENKPCYLMGEGNPIWLLEAIALGVDCFDSRYPTQSARRGTIFTKNGKIKILNKKYEYDKTPIDKKCDCFTCKNYSRTYVRFLLRENEPVGKELASYHNLYFMKWLIEEAKKHIKKNTFIEFLEKMKKTYK